MNDKYNHKKIEKKWQHYWDNNNVFKSNLNSNNKKYYVLDMFPYPSGLGIHIGHCLGYTASDIISRFKKMKGYEVLHPMGWDAFGLPAEQYAIKTKNNPNTFTQSNINNFKFELKRMGFSFDWDKEINTSDPKYYRNTQWIFSQLYKHNLAKIMDIEVNWSNSLNTVLSNEEILVNDKGIDVSERDGLPVFKKKMKQWVLKITEYKDELFDGLEKLNWPNSTKNLQRNWIFKKDDNGNYTSELHLRDWIFSRQRYWGEPFPIIHGDDGEIYLVPSSDYPVELPIIEKYNFSSDGKPPLSNASEWINYDENNIRGKRDLNIMPQWAGSCWYYIGYLLKNSKGYLNIESPEARKLINKWLPVDLYIGGQEHAVLHLLYSRFWFIFLRKINIFNVEEPFQKLFHQGMILGNDNLKMSKSKGNTVSPIELVDKYGADALRVYLMFSASLNDDRPWNEDKLSASKKWVNKFYNFYNFIMVTTKEDTIETKKEFNIFLINIEKNISNLKFNLAVTNLMVFLNWITKNPSISSYISHSYLRVANCIIPHITEELNELIFKKDSSNFKNLYTGKWPTLFKDVDISESNVTIPLQINGKLRALINSSELANFNDLKTNKDIIAIAKKFSPKYVDETKKARKVIFIKNKVINIVF